MYTLDVVAGDRIILCSDGLTDMVRERDIERIARSESDPQRAAELLVDAANAAGGVDNITVVVLDVEEVEADAALDPEALLVDADPPLTPVPQVRARRARAHTAGTAHSARTARAAARFCC